MAKRIVLASLLKVAANRALEKGVFVSAGVGRDELGRIETHLHVTTWDGRYDHGHQPPLLGKASE